MIRVDLSNSEIRCSRRTWYSPKTGVGLGFVQCSRSDALGQPEIMRDIDGKTRDVFQSLGNAGEGFAGRG